MRPGAHSQYGLIVIVDGVVATHTLPQGGHVTLGRARENDIQIIDPSVSRVHARLRVDFPMTIEDMSSANGTRVRGELIQKNEPMEVPLGEAMELGSTMVMVQRRPVATREWRIWAHGYFEGRLEDECARANRSGVGFALVRLRSEDESSAAVIQQVLANTLRDDDVVGLYGPNEYEVLLVERTDEESELLVQTLSDALSAAGLDTHIGLARFPTDGRTAERLTSHAGSKARGDGTDRAGGKLILRSQAMSKLYELVERVAPGDISVLVLGDTGVGKEVMAEEVHRASPRKNRPFLRLNCAALSESLLESELFGHERGAFTGAHQAKAGLLETAQGGTVFLDEIGELPMTMQVKLLRVLEERQVWRVGGVKPRAIDVRFVAATNRDLEAEVEAGNFRQDLFFRLNGISLVIPPLRERLDEIEPLAREFVLQVSQQLGRSEPTELTPEVLQLMLHYSWPGNIRELRNTIERAVLLAGSGPILREHFPVEKMTATVSTPLSQPPTPTSEPPAEPPNAEVIPKDTLVPPAGEDNTEASLSLGERLRQQVKEVERQHIMDALSRCGGNQTRAAKELGISRRTLISRLEEYNIPRPLKDRRAE